MKIGQTGIRYYDPDGASHNARVTDIVGSGNSNAKILDLSYRSDGDEVTIKSVPHERDFVEGSGYWMLRGEKRTRTNDTNVIPPEAPGDLSMSSSDAPAVVSPSENDSPIKASSKK